jgi:IclR family pca regulon transcriptional regulator
VLLAHLPAAHLTQYLARIQPIRYTPHTVIAKEKLRALIDTARKDGYSVVDEELEIGLRSIAVPVVDNRGKVTAAINASTQASRLPMHEFRLAFLPALKKAASELDIHD